MEGEKVGLSGLWRLIERILTKSEIGHERVRNKEREMEGERERESGDIYPKNQ